MLIVIAFIVGLGLGIALDLFYLRKIIKKNPGDMDNDGVAWTEKDQAAWMKEKFTHNNPRKKKTNKGVS